MEGSGVVTRPSLGLVASVLLVCLRAIGIPPPAAAGADPSLYRELLPDNPLYCPLAGNERRLTDALEGRPLVVFLTDLEKGYDNPLGTILSDCQSEFGPWFSWAGVMVGEASKSEIEKMKTRSPLSLETCFQDVDGLWWRDLQVGPLPAVVLANEDGYILARYSGADSRQGQDLLPVILERTARAGNLKGKPARDFRLPDPVTGEYFSLFDVSGPEYTTLLFLDSSCDDCLRELRVLERIRRRYPARTSLVTVFHDHPDSGSIGPTLESQAIEPDYVLSDPDMRHAGSYLFESVPVLLLIGPDGRIVLSRKGYRSEDALELAAALDGVLFGSSSNPAVTPFRRARRIAAEGMEFFAQGDYEMAALYWERSLEIFPAAGSVHLPLGEAYRLLGRKRDAARHYGLYLSSGTGGYDLALVKEKLRELSGLPR